MDIAETNAGSGVQKSAVSESSHEVSVEKTAQGTKESSISAAKRAEQSLEQKVQGNVQSTVQKSLQESVQQESSRTVQQSVTSSAGKNGETVTVTEEVITHENGNEIIEVVEEDDDTPPQTIVTETITEGPNGEKIITRTTKVIGAAKKITKKVQTPGETVVTKTTTTSESKPTTKVVKKVVKKVVSASEPEEEQVVIVTKTKTESAPVEKVVEAEEEQVTVTIKPKKAEPVKEETVVEKVEVVEEVEEEEVVEEKAAEPEPEPEPEPEAKPEPEPEPVAEPEPVKEEVVEEEVVEEEVVEEEVVEEPAKPEPAVEAPRPKDPSPKLEDVGDDEDEEEETEESEEEEEPVKPQPKTQIPTEEVKPASEPPVQTPQQPDEQREIKQENIKNTLKEIISDMDRVIEQEEEKSTVVKGSENGTDYEQSTYDHVTKYSTYKLTGLGGEQDKPGHSIYPSRPTFIAQDSNIPHTFKPSSASQFYTPKKEPSAPTNHVDLQKIFTPAHDAEEILPSNRHRKKLFASSQFYSSGLHPTVEDQVELARRISHSLSDISNKQSKGQTMYSNRKKRSVKWVHEGEGRADLQSYNGYTEEIKENEFYQRQQQQHTPYQQGGRLPLKLVMDPRGQVRDLESLRRQGYNIEAPMQSPEICNEVVNALHAPKGKGAELFAKRRRKADKYIIDENTAAKHSPSGVPYVQSPGSTLPAFTEAGSQRVQQSIKYDQLIQEKYNNSQSRVKLVKSPWEAALETGYVDNAFQDATKQSHISQPSYDYNNSTPSGYYQPPPAQELPTPAPRPRPAGYTSSAQRDLAYKPSVPQGWRAPPAQLPRDEYDYMLATADNIYDTLTPTNSVNENHISELQQNSQQYRTTQTDQYQNSEEAEITQINEQSFRATKKENELQIKQNYLSCVSKSPELIVADARQQYSQYDNTMRELKGAIIQQTQQIKLEPLQPLQNVKLKKVVTKEEYPIQDGGGEDNENAEDYKPVPVKDLINNFENQIRPIMRYKVIGESLPPPKLPSQGMKNSAFEEYKKPSSQELLPQQTYTNVINLPAQQPVYEPPKPVQQLIVGGNSTKTQTKINYQNVCRATTCEKTNYEKQQELKQKYLQTHEEYEEAHEEQQTHQQSIMYDETSNAITSYQNQNNENFMYSSLQNNRPSSYTNHQITNSYEKSSASAIQSSCLENYSSQKDSESSRSKQGLYTPPEIPLSGYDPPATEQFLPKSSKPSYGSSSYGSSTLPPPTIVTQPAPTQQYQPQQQQQQLQPQSTYQNQQQSYQSYQTKTTQNYYSSQQQTKVGNVSPAPFGQSSPAPHRPQPQQYQPQQGYHPKSPLPQPVNQSVPWAKNVQRSLPQQQKFNNPSPVSYGTSPTQGYGGKSQQHHQQQHQSHSYGSTPSATLPKPQQQQQQYSSAPANGYGTYPGRTSSNLSPSYIQSAPVSPHANVDLSSCKNYNTAARGWNQSKDYYRPIHLDQKAKKTALPYSDF